MNRTVAANNPEVGENWVNHSVKGLFPGKDSNPVVVLDVPGIRVSAASTEYLLALKVFAARIDRDDDDVTFLADQLGLTTSDEVLDVMVRFYPAKRIEAKVQFYIQQLFGH